MGITKIIKELAPELRDASNLNAGLLDDQRLRESLRAAGKAIPNRNYNQAVEPGFYAGNGATLGSNDPPELARYGMLLVGRSEGTYVWQICGFGSSGVGVNEAQLYYRGSNNNGSAWGAWKRVFHQGSILGTVSQSGGYPTGAIIERGSNANGEYVKYADGTMICWVNKNLVTGSAQYWGSTLFTTPATFASGIFRVVASIDAPSSNQIITACGIAASASTYTLYLNCQSSNNLSNGVNAVLIGRWF